MATRSGVMSSALLWSLVLGGVGFACGFFGPIALNPDANQGPLLGIFITGPSGALLGLALGATVALVGLGPALRRALLSATAVVWGASVLVRCLPDPEYRGEIIEGAVRACIDPAERIAAATAEWEKLVADAPGAKVPPGWQQDAAKRLTSEPGWVVSVSVERTRPIYMNRKPWNRETLADRAWVLGYAEREFFVSAEGTPCSDLVAAGRSFYHPSSETARTWPPDRLPNYLDLTTLGPVPDAYRALLD